MQWFVAADPGRSIAVSVLPAASTGPRFEATGSSVVRPAASLLKLLVALALYDAAATGEVG